MRRFALLVVLVMLAGGCAPTLTPVQKKLLVRGTPLLDQLAGEPLFPRGGDSPARIAAVEADDAWTRGDAAAAMGYLARAAAALPPEAPVCRQVGALFYLQGLAAQLAGDDRAEQGWDRLAERCLQAEVAPAEQPAQHFFHLLTARPELDTGSDGESASAARMAQKKWLRQLAEAADSLTGPRQEILVRYGAWLKVREERQNGRCDTGLDARHFDDRVRAYKALERAGRPDLAMDFWSGIVMRPDGELDFGPLQTFTAWTEASENRWLRRQTIAGVLSAIRYGANWPDPLQTAPLCATLFGDIEEALQADRARGFNGRNVSRVMAAFQASGACLQQAALGRLMDGALAVANEGEEGNLGTLHLVGGIGLQLILEAVAGRTDTLWAVLGQLSRALEQVRLKLGTTPEDRALEAVLKVLLAAPNAFQGQAPSFMKSIDHAVEVFDELLVHGVPEEAPELIQVLPGIRAGTLATRALVAWLLDSPVDARQSLLRLQDRLQADLSALLVHFDQPDHSVALVGVVEAATELVSRLTGQEVVNWARLEKLTGEKLAPRKGEEGWWQVGLQVLRAITWDVYAGVAFGRDADDFARRALGHGEQLTGEAVAGFLELLDVPPTVATILRMLPPLHRAIPDLLDDSLEGEALALAVAARLNGLGPLLDGPDSPVAGTGTVSGLVNELVTAALKTGLENLIREPKKALAQMTELLEKRAASYPEDVRGFLLLVAAVGRYYGAPETAAEAFARAAALVEQHLPELAYVPMLTHAMLLRSDNADLTTLRPVVEKVLAYGEAAHQCGEAHAVDSLLPAAAWLYEAVGDHAAAQAAYGRFVGLVDQGYAGETPVSCRLESRAEHFVFTMDIGNTTAGFLLGGKSEGTFQVGMGAEMGSEGKPMGDDLRCVATTLEAPRYDRIMEAHLAWAMYAFRHDDDAGAHRALQRAVAVGRQMLHGSAVTLGPRRAALVNDSRNRLALDLVAQTALVARLRGHWQTADILEQIGATIAPAQEKNWTDVVDADQPVPALLARLPEYTNLGPLVRQWQRVRTRAVADALAKELTRWGKETGLVAAWGVVLARDLLESALPEAEQQERPRTLEFEGKSDLGEAAYRLRNLLMAGGLDQKLPPMEKMQETFEALAGLGLRGEFGGPLNRYALFAAQSNDAASAVKLLQLGLDLLPLDKAPVLRLDCLLLLAEVLVQANEVPAAFEVYKALVPGLDGYHDAETDINARWALGRIFGNAGDGAALQESVRQLLPRVHRVYSGSHPLFYTLESLDVALRYLAGVNLPDSALQALDDHALFVGGDTKEQRNFIQLLLQTDDPALRRTLSEQYLIFVFQDGPKPALPDEAGQEKPER